MTVDNKSLRLILPSKEPKPVVSETPSETPASSPPSPPSPFDYDIPAKPDTKDPIDGHIHHHKGKRDLCSSSRYIQVGSAFAGQMGNATAYASHQKWPYTTVYGNIMGAILGIMALFMGKVVSPLLYPVYKMIRRKLGFKEIDESVEIPTDNIWHRSFRTAGLLALNLVMFPGAIIAALAAQNIIKISFLDGMEIAAANLLIGISGGILAGGIAAAIQYVWDKKTAQKKKAAEQQPTEQLHAKPAPKPQFSVDSWSRGVKAGIVAGSQFGLLIGNVFAAIMLPLPIVKELPIVNSLINGLCSIGGSIIGGCLFFLAAPLAARIDQSLAEKNWYRKIFRVMADINDTNNPPSNRIKAGVAFGTALGTVAGFLAGLALPGLGSFIGMGIGSAAGGVFGGVIGYVIEPVMRYLQNPYQKELRSANPWSNRIRAGAIYGTCFGLLLGSFFPGIGTFLGAAIGSVAGAVFFTIIEPLHVHRLTLMYGERVRDDEDLLQDTTGNPWTSRLPVGCMFGMAVGGAIGLIAGWNPATVIIGAAIGGAIGGFLGMCFVDSIRAKLTGWVAPIYNKLVKKIEQWCGEPAAEPKPAVTPKVTNTQNQILSLFAKAPVPEQETLIQPIPSSGSGANNEPENEFPELETKSLQSSPTLTASEPTAAMQPKPAKLVADDGENHHDLMTPFSIGRTAYTTEARQTDLFYQRLRQRRGGSQKSPPRSINASSPAQEIRI